MHWRATVPSGATPRWLCFQTNGSASGAWPRLEGSACPWGGSGFFPDGSLHLEESRAEALDGRQRSRVHALLYLLLRKEAGLWTTNDSQPRLPKSQTRPSESPLGRRDGHTPCRLAAAPADPLRQYRR